VTHVCAPPIRLHILECGELAVVKRLLAVAALLETVPGGSHMLQDTHPERLAGAITAFVAGGEHWGSDPAG
jgi:pimeloyl-ACP methyl ester carboxylesterase